MNPSLRSKVFPKSRHFGFKRPVFIDPEDNDTEKENENEKDQINENDKKSEKKETEPQPENPAPKKMDIQLLSFSISTELLNLQDNSSTPGFDWIHESESREKIFNDSSFVFDEQDLNKGLNDNFDPNPII